MNYINNILKKNKIALISIYFGEKPVFINLFLNSAKNNKNFDFHIFSDWKDLSIESFNIFYHELTLSEFNKIAFEKKILSVEIVNPYKLCDLKPAWPYILDHYFYQYEYDYIGYCDTDIMFGNIDSFIKYDLKLKPDIWTIHSGYMAGSFLLFRNNKKIKTLFKYNDYYKLIFNSQSHFAFDEKFLPQYENLSLNGIFILSFTDIINNLEKNGIITTIRKDNILFEGRPENIVFKNGRFFDRYSNELFGFHFLNAKKYLLWAFPKWEKLPPNFSINKYGFYINNKLTLLNLLINYNYLKQILIKFRQIKLLYIIKNNSFNILVRSFINQF